MTDDEDPEGPEQQRRDLPAKNREALAEKQRSQYARTVDELETWLLERGVEPETYEGYSEDTVRRMLYRIHDFYLYVWDTSGFTTYPGTDAADEYMQTVARSDDSGSHKNNVRKALQALYRWLSFTGRGDEWQFDRTFATSSTSSWDCFSTEERQRIRMQVLDDPIPPYDDLDEDEREKYLPYLAQKFGMPKEEVGRTEWRRITGYNIPALIHTAFDIGIRPKEVERLKTEWLDLANNQILIPKDDAVKSDARWNPVIQEHTAELLTEWLEERDTYPEYEDSDLVWLNQSGNPYTTRTLNPLLERVLDWVDIDTEGRNIVWYSIRHTTATYMANEVGLKHAKEQLRHNSIVTTLRYVHSQPDVRRSGLERMDSQPTQQAQPGLDVGRGKTGW